MYSNMKIARTSSQRRHQAGLTLIEMMVSLVIGLVILAGVLSVFASSRRAFDMSESEAAMLDSARFAMHLIEEDMRAAGSFGRNSWAAGIERRAGQPNALGTISGDCAPLWYIDLDRKIFVRNDDNPYPTTCIGSSANYKALTDVLVVRYAQPTPLLDAQLVQNVIYVQSTPGHGELFDVDQGIPTFATDFNHPLQAIAYYVSENTEPGDGYPSLHRISLGTGPRLNDTVIAPGVEEFHVQLGLDDCNPECDGSANYYVDPDHPDVDFTNIAFVDRVLAVRVWMLIRAEVADGGEYRNTETYLMGGRKFTPPAGDSYRRLLVSSVFQIRNGATE